MDGWRPIDQIAQLKWTLMASGHPLLNESELAAMILNMLIKICSSYPTRDVDGAVIRPLPRAKRMLSDPSALPHQVQLLLTFDPSLVDKVVTLLNDIMQDNPQLPRLFMSGVFFFIMMYTGSNVLPIAKFLQYTHMKQSFRPDDQQPSASDIMLRSILGQLLPEAMVHYLENHGPEKFSSIYLGEFDTPEAIWNSEMRRLMIEKIASHIADFSPRLMSNTRANYQYCAMPVIQYPQLENELFCNIYYLRHLCDTQKFPDWPIKEPVKVLKDVLMEWKREVEKKPPEMSVDQAYESLGLATGVGGHEESVVRKAYFKMAQKYHPDKNPEGRSTFEAVNKAYEFLCSKSARSTTQGPDPEKIVLLLKTQSILFTRCAETLQPYKYAGYPMLIKTIERETGDDDLFSKSAPILTAASEVAYHTMNNSALNAEELCRENGIPILQNAFSRCVSVLSSLTKEDEMAVQVCIHICRCYRVSAQFEICREAMVEVRGIVTDLCRVLYYKNLPRLNVVGTQAVSAFAVDEWLQNQLLEAGVLWHILQFVFNYDYTLDEGGVETSDETNQQEVANNLARLSLMAAARLGGFKLGEEPTPYNKTIQSIFSTLLTPYLAKLLSRNTVNELLKILNSNSETPYLIWDNRTRTELLEYLKEQQQSIIRTGECDTTYGAEFKYDILKDELVIGEVYIRVYNEQPTFVLEDPKGFVAALLDFIGTNAQYLHSFMALTSTDVDTSKQGQHAERLKNVEMALEALYNVLHANSGVEIHCVGHFKLLFSLLAVQGANKLQLAALKAISEVTANKTCVSNIADSNVVQYLMLVLHTLPACKSCDWHVPSYCSIHVIINSSSDGIRSLASSHF
jgi:DnaJ family protein C protein 13